MFDIRIEAEALRVGLKRNKPFMYGKLSRRCKVSGSMWIIGACLRWLRPHNESRAITLSGCYEFSGLINYRHLGQPLLLTTVQFLPAVIRALVYTYMVGTQMTV